MTLAQLIRSRKALPPVILLMGRCTPLRRWAIQEILARRHCLNTLTDFVTTDTTPEHLIGALSRLPSTPSATLYGPLEACARLAPLADYARSPRKYLTLILWAEGKRQDRREQPWIPAGQFVTTVDVGSGFEVERLRSFAVAVGVPGVAVDALLARVGEDPELLVDALRILQVMPRPWDWPLIEAVVPDATPSCSFAEYHVASHASPVVVASQLLRRFRQLALLATYKPLRLQPPDLSRETGIPTWLLADFKALTKHRSAADWVHKMVLAQKGLEYARAGLPLVKEWLYVSL